MNRQANILDINNEAHTIKDKAGDKVPGQPGKKRLKSWAEMWPGRYGRNGTVTTDTIKGNEQVARKVESDFEFAQVQADEDAYNFLIENEAITKGDVIQEKNKLVGLGFHVHPRLDELLEMVEKSPTTIQRETADAIKKVEGGTEITEEDIASWSPATRNHPIVKKRLDAMAKWSETNTYKDMEKSLKHTISSDIGVRPDQMRATTFSQKEKEALHKITAYAQKMLAQGTVKTDDEAKELRKNKGEDITPADAALLADKWFRNNRDKGELFHREKIDGVRDYHNIRSSDHNFSSFTGEVILPNTFINSLPQQPDQVQSLLKNEVKLNKLIADNEELGTNWNEYFGKNAELNTAIPEKAFILSKQANIPIAEVLEKLNIHNGHGILNPKLKDALLGELGRVLHPKLLTALIQGYATTSEANQIKAKYWFNSPEGIIEKTFRGPLGDEVKYVNTETGHEYYTPILISLLGVLSEELGEDVSSDLQPGGLSLILEDALYPPYTGPLASPSGGLNLGASIFPTNFVAPQGMDHDPDATRKQRAENVLRNKKLIDLLSNETFLKFYSQFDPRANVILDIQTPEDLRKIKHLTGQDALEAEWVEALQLTT